MRDVSGDIMCGIKAPTLHTAMAKMAVKGATASSALRRAGVHKRRRAASATVHHTEAARRLLRFLRLAKLLSTAPWANKKFVVNEDIFMRMTASHLGLICGSDVATAERATLLRLLPTADSLDNA